MRILSGRLGSAVEGVVLWVTSGNIDIDSPVLSRIIVVKVLRTGNYLSENLLNWEGPLSSLENNIAFGARACLFRTAKWDLENVSVQYAIDCKNGTIFTACGGICFPYTEDRKLSRDVTPQHAGLAVVVSPYVGPEVPISDLPYPPSHLFDTMRFMCAFKGDFESLIRAAWYYMVRENVMIACVTALACIFEYSIPGSDDVKICAELAGRLLAHLEGKPMAPIDWKAVLEALIRTHKSTRMYGRFVPGIGEDVVIVPTVSRIVLEELVSVGRINKRFLYVNGMRAYGLTKTPIIEKTPPRPDHSTVGFIGTPLLRQIYPRNYQKFYEIELVRDSSKIVKAYTFVHEGSANLGSTDNSFTALNRRGYVYRIEAGGCELEPRVWRVVEPPTGYIICKRAEIPNDPDTWRLGALLGERNVVLTNAHEVITKYAKPDGAFDLPTTETFNVVDRSEYEVNLLFLLAWIASAAIEYMGAGTFCVRDPELLRQLIVASGTSPRVTVEWYPHGGAIERAKALINQGYQPVAPVEASEIEHRILPADVIGHLSILTEEIDIVICDLTRICMRIQDAIWKCKNVRRIHVIGESASNAGEWRYWLVRSYTNIQPLVQMMGEIVRDVGGFPPIRSILGVKTMLTLYTAARSLAKPLAIIFTTDYEAYDFVSLAGTDKCGDIDSNAEYIIVQAREYYGYRLAHVRTVLGYTELAVRRILRRCIHPEVQGVFIRAGNEKVPTASEWFHGDDLTKIQN
jgi:hypothetical protein